MQKNLAQIAAFKDKTRHRFVLAGRRGGKTTLIKEDITKSIVTCPDRGEIFYIGPTNQQALELIWEPLVDKFSELKWRFNPVRYRQLFEFSRGRKIYVIGAEKIRRIRGHAVYRAYLDELAFFTADLGQVWQAVRPALADLNGRAFTATTPNGKGTQAYDFYLESLKKEEWSYHHWLTKDNPVISASEVESAKRELDEKSFKQEYEASWESFEGLCYYSFDENLHIANCSKFILSEPISMMWDFNVNPTTLLVGQYINNHHFIRKEYSLKNSSTPATLKSFCEDFKKLKTKIVLEVYGDATGSGRRSVVGHSDYDEIMEGLESHGFNYQMRVPGSNPGIIDRVSKMNSALKSYNGASSITIDPSCSDLIRDLSSQPLEGRFPSDKNNLGHKGDALGYHVYWHYLQKQIQPQHTIQL